MAKSNPNFFAWNSGELSPLLLNRQDQARYAYGARRMRNFIPTLQGPVRKRPGIKFVAQIGDESERAWLFRFVFEQRDSYIIEFGDGYIRFYTDEAQVTETAVTITSMTNASPGVFTKATHGLSVNDEVYIATMPGTTGIAGRSFRVNTVPTADTFTLKDMWGTALDTTSLGTYTGSGTFARVYQIASPWAASDLVDDDGCCTISAYQDSDVVYVCVPGFQSRKLTRSAPASWALSLFDPTDGPFKTVDPDNTITVYAGAATGNTTLTASSGIFTPDHVGALFLLEKKATEIVTSWETAKAISTNDLRRSQGHYYKALNTATTGTITPSHTEGSRYDGDGAVNWEYQHSGYGWAQITAYNSATSVDITVLSQIPTGAVGSGNASTRWAFGAWSEAEGWPTHVTLFRERLFFGRGTQLWGSVPSDFESFAQRDAGVIADDSAIAIDIRNGSNDSILWMKPAASLLIGSAGGERSVSEISAADPLGPSNIAPLDGPGYGSRRVEPAMISNRAIYAQTGGRTIRELFFSFETDNYESSEKTAFAEHIAKGKVIRMAYAKEPASIVWMACENGDLIAMSYQREHDLLAFHKHPIGGDGLCEDVCVIPSPDGATSQTWVIARFTLNGVTKRFIGFMEEDWDWEDGDAEDQFYVDFGLSYSGPAATQFRADHLKNQTCPVFADGAYIGDFTFSSSGVVDISSVRPDGCADVHVGFAYTATLETMPFNRPGFLARVVRGFIRLFGSLHGAIGSAWKDGDARGAEATRPLQLRAGALPLATVTPPYTGIKFVDQVDGDRGREASLVITHSAPTAFNVGGVVCEIQHYPER